MDRITIMEILRDACRAPSGDNTQPWRFEVTGSVIEVFNVPEKDTSLFNWNQSTNHIALGTCIQNLCISAEGKGYRVNYELFPNISNALLVAKISLEKDSGVKNPLAQQIAVRSTNRKKYQLRALEENDVHTLRSTAEGTGVRIEFRTNGSEISELAQIVSTGERLALEDQSIHEFLFSHVTWSHKEDAIKHGFLIDTFEFIPPQKIVFRLFSQWNILRIFLPFGISKLIALDMGRIHKTSAGFCSIIMKNISPESYVEVGMVLEKMWLTATERGLYFQPTTTVHLIGRRVESGDVGSLALKHQDLIKAQYKKLKEIFKISPAETIGFMVRVGYAEKPTTMTSRFEPDVVFKG